MVPTDHLGSSEFHRPVEAAPGTGDAAPDTSGSTSDERPSQPHPQGPPPRRARCRYFGQKSGCRSGAACPFRHDTSDVNQQSIAALQQQQSQQQQLARKSHQPSSNRAHHAADMAEGRAPIAPSGAGDTAARQPGAPNPSRITQRPIPQSQVADPRAYQVSQVRRRYSPVDERFESDASVLTFRLAPSDPDFPYELDALHCSLRVPLDYPKGDRPTLRISNPEMERGYQINVERGFDRIVAASKNVNLLACLNALDRQLEALLSEEKAETIKLLLNQGKPKAVEPKMAPPAMTVAPKTSQPPFTPASFSAPVSMPDAATRERAKGVRGAEVRQLEARLGKLPQFSKSPDGLSFTVPIDVRKTQSLPIELQAIKLVRLIVPEMYNVAPCRIELMGVSGPAADAVVAAFEKRAKEMSNLSLFNHINFLSQNMHLMAKVQAKAAVTHDAQIVPPSPPAHHPASPKNSEPGSSASVAADLSDRSHIVVIPRPPEFELSNNENADHSEESSSESEDGDDAQSDGLTDDEAKAIPQPSSATSRPAPERGILISFPHVELHGIELLEVSALNITVKCDRCKATKDIRNLRTGAQQPRSESCNKCAAAWAVGFRGELLHASSIRAGYIDLEGCTVVDMLLSSFVPTCSECSQAYPLPGVNAVRGDSSIAFCRSCHRKMTFRLPEIKFLRTGASGLALKATAAGRKKKQDSLGIVAGRELPNRGRCTHYKKSYRWFRFSCCDKVFPCDRCHDEGAPDHTLEMANRMICGFCSREQNYRPKDCGICHAWLTVRPGKGFWEGGAGTRDRSKMSRKDPRKYKKTKAEKDRLKEKLKNIERA